jgi:hypothetical protein
LSEFGDDLDVKTVVCKWPGDRCIVWFESAGVAVVRRILERQLTRIGPAPRQEISEFHASGDVQLMTDSMVAQRAAGSWRYNVHYWHGRVVIDMITQ